MRKEFDGNPDWEPVVAFVDPKARGNDQELVVQSEEDDFSFIYPVNPMTEEPLRIFGMGYMRARLSCEEFHEAVVPFTSDGFGIVYRGLKAVRSLAKEQVFNHYDRPIIAENLYGALIAIQIDTDLTRIFTPKERRHLVDDVTKKIVEAGPLQCIGVYEALAEAAPSVKRAAYLRLREMEQEWPGNPRVIASKEAYFNVLEAKRGSHVRKLVSF